MARCRCSTEQCVCSVEAGPGIDISGGGAPGDPWVISGVPSSVGTVQVADTATLDLTLAGTGTVADPFIISGNTSQLPGGIAVGPGISGSGSAADPLRINLCTYADLKAACAP